MRSRAKRDDYQHLYKTPRWGRMRKAQLARAPLCVMCARAGQVTQATVADHIKPHRGSRALFFDSANLQSLCKPHHDSAKQGDEVRGYSVEVGVDGWPIDPQHPANR